MAFAVILYFDPATEAGVQALWNVLARQGISSVMARMGIRPHISLAGLEDLEPGPLCGVLRGLSASTPPLTVNLSAVGTFPTAQGVVYLAPAVSPALVRLHAALHARLTALGLASTDYYRPENWVPHCTVTINLPPDQVAAAVNVCRASNVFRPAHLTEIALVEYMPIAELCVFPLGDAASTPAR